MTETEPSNLPQLRVGVFLDEPNIHVSLRNLKTAFDAEELLTRVRGLGRLAIAHAYISMRSEDQAETAAQRAGATGDSAALVNRGLLSTSDWLARKYNSAGYSVRMVPPGSDRKDVDTSLSVEAARAVMEDRVDLLVIGSGDADCIPLADLAHEMGKTVCIAAVPDSCSPALRARADVFLAIPSPTSVVSPVSPRGR